MEPHALSIDARASPGFRNVKRLGTLPLPSGWDASLTHVTPWPAFCEVVLIVRWYTFILPGTCTWIEAPALG